MPVLIRSTIIVVCLVLLSGCNQSDNETTERLSFADSAPAVTTSTVPPTTTTIVDPRPKVSLTCPPDDSGAWATYRAEFGADIVSDGFTSATIQYGDGKSYESRSWADAEQNMFWHTYKTPGSFFVSVEVTDAGGRQGRGTCIFNWKKDVQPPLPPAPQSTPAPSPDCDPNYSGGCVPIASDVDCAGGSGNGPAYVRGPVYIVGADIYGLDRDNDGVGCE